MVKIYFIILLTSSIRFTFCARILAVFPTPSISHQMVFRHLINELVRRGHEVTVITTDPQYTRNQISNLTEIDVHDISYKLWREEFAKAPNEKTVDIISQARTTLKILLKLVLVQVEQREVQDIFKNKAFDLLIIEAFAKPALIYSHFFKVPVVQISSFGGLSDNYKTVGAMEHAFLYPSILQRRYYNLTKWEKIYHFLNHWRIENIFNEANEEGDETLKRKYGSEFPSLKELCDNVHMLFLNIHPIWTNNQPVPTNVIYIHGIDTKPSKPLPKDVQSLLDTSSHGVIYFSFGTSINLSLIPLEKIQIFIRVFSKLKYDVIWKWNEDLAGKSNNIHIFKWLPQADLLKHPKIKLFICQAGLHSTDEAIRAEVPVIGIPVQVDQWHNAEKYVYHKIGMKLEMAELNEVVLKDAIENVIGNKSYKDNIAKLRIIMEDQADSPLERAVWWTEYVIRHNGAKHLRAVGANISKTQYFELELISVIIFFVLLLIIVAFVSIYKTINYVKLLFNTKMKVS